MLHGAIFVSTCLAVALQDKLQLGRLQRVLKPGLHIVVSIPEHVCKDAHKGFLKLSTYRLQTLLVKDQYMSSLQRCRDQAIPV